MKGFLKILLMLVVFFVFKSAVWTQNVIFVESQEVQRAMENYRNSFIEKTELSGYRVQYLFTNDRREMEQANKKFSSLFGNFPNDWKHDPPYYKLYAGAFLDRSEAMRFLNRVRDKFSGAILVNSTVKIQEVYECRHKLDGW